MTPDEYGFGLMCVGGGVMMALGFRDTVTTGQKMFIAGLALAIGLAIRIWAAP
jgi:hypothetical protein